MSLFAKHRNSEEHSFRNPALSDAGIKKNYAILRRFNCRVSQRNYLFNLSSIFLSFIYFPSTSDSSATFFFLNNYLDKRQPSIFYFPIYTYLIYFFDKCFYLILLIYVIKYSNQFKKLIS